MNINQYRNLLSNLEAKDKQPITMQEVGDLGYTAASVAPITGEAIAIKELPQDVNQIAELFKQGYSEMDFKKMGLGALFTAAVAAGLIPVAGGLARIGKQPLKKAIGALGDIKGTAKTNDFFSQLDSGIIQDKNSLNFLRDQVENKLDEAMINRPEGVKFSYEENELTGILNDLDDIEKNNVFPATLNFENIDAKEIYENKIAKDIKEIYEVPVDNKGLGAVRMNRDILREEYGIDLDK